MALLPDTENTAKQLKETSHLNVHKLAGKQPSETNSARIRELLAEYQGKGAGEP